MSYRSLWLKLISCMTSVMLITGISVAVYAATPAGTVITAGSLAIQYSDGQHTSVSTNVTIGGDTIVQPIYGIEVTPAVSVTASLVFNGTAYYHQVLTNKGNTTDPVIYSLDALTPGGWTASVYLDSNNDGIHDAGETTLVTSPITLSAEATRSIFIALTAPSAYITPGSVVFHPSTNGSPAGIYTGYNGQLYGGISSQRVTENAIITDAIAPAIVPRSPTSGAQNVPIDSLVAFDITDLESGISLNTLRVTVNGTAYLPTATVAITNGYRVSVDPADFAYAATINVSVFVSDIAGNAQYVTYDFKTRAQSTAINLTAYLHGYMNTLTRVHRAATINIQLRSTRNINAGPSVNVALNVSGNTGVVGIETVPGPYYLVIRQSLAGSPLGVNHVAYVSSESITILSEQVTTINVATANSAYYARPFIPRSGYSPLLLENGVLVVKGGEATGERVINVTDIIRWNNAATNSNADTRGKSQWTEDPNFDGDPYMNTDDFSIWNKNKGQNVPLPEED